MSLFTAAGVARVSITGSTSLDAEPAVVQGAPVWSSTPTYTITAGQASTQAIPVSAGGASITMAWVSPGSKPSWITLNSGTSPTITFSGAQVDSDDVASMVLSATASSQTVNSSAGSITINAVVSTSSSLWEVVDQSSITVSYPSGLTTAYAGSPGYRIPGGKDLRGHYNSSDGRIYYGGGDWPTDATGLSQDAGPGSGSIGMWSVNPSSPTSFRYEHHRSWFDPTYVMPEGLDQGGMVYDSTLNKFWVFPVQSFYAWQALRVGATPNVPSESTSDPLVVPQYVTSTRFTLAGNWTASLSANQLFKLYINHSLGGTYGDAAYVPYIVARINGTPTYDGTNTTVNFTAWSAITWPTFSALGAQAVEFFGLTGSSWNTGARKTGAWLDNGYIGYNESTGKFVAGLLKMTPGNGSAISKYERVNFELGSTISISTAGATLSTTAISRTDLGHNLMLLSSTVLAESSVTGRNRELIYPSAIRFNGAWIYDLSTFTGNKYVNGGAGHDSISTDVDFGPGRAGCNAGLDATRKRIWMMYGYYQQLVYYDITLRVLKSAGTISDADQYSTSGSSPVVYNDEIGMVEVYSQAFGENPPKVLLIDPTTTPYTVHVLANSTYDGRAVTYVDGNLVNGMNWVRAGSRSYATGEVSSSPYKRINFIGGNLKWSEVTASTHWYTAPLLASGGVSGPRRTDLAAAVQTSLVPGVPFGGGAWEVDSSGIPTGVYMNHAGGDADYAGNEVTVCRFDQLTGTVFNCTTNLAASQADMDVWRNRVHMSYRQGGTASPEVFANPSDYTDWQPATAHIYGATICVPGYGLVRHCQIPPGGSVTPELNNGPYTSPSYVEYNTTTFGASSVGMRDPLNDYPTTGYGLAYWSRTTGKWQVLPSGVSPNINRDQLADWNTTTGKLVGYRIGSADTVTVFEWSVAAGYSVVRTIAPASISNNPTGAGFAGNETFESNIYWLTGNTYFIVSSTSGARRIITYDHSTGAAANQTLTGTYLATEFAAGREPTCWVDRQLNKVWWIFGYYTGSTQPLTIYYSPISDFLNLKKLRTYDADTFFANMQVSGLGPRRFCQYNGFLWLTGSKIGSVMPGTNWPSQRIFRLPVF